MSIERKLAAIMFTDIVGYTAKMSKSESKTLEDREVNSIIDLIIKKVTSKFKAELRA